MSMKHTETGAHPEPSHTLLATLFKKKNQNQKRKYKQYKLTSWERHKQKQKIKYVHKAIRNHNSSSWDSASCSVSIATDLYFASLLLRLHSPRHCL